MNVELIALKDRLLTLLFWLLLGSRSIKPDKNDVRRILIWGHMGLGNLLMFMPAIKAFKQHFRRASLSLVVGREYLIELIEPTDLIQDFLVFPEKTSFVQKLRFLGRIRKERFDLVVKTFCTSSCYTIIGLSGISHRVGHVSSPGWAIRDHGVFNHRARMTKNQHEIDRGLQLFYAIGGTQDETHRDFTLRLPMDAVNYAARFLEENSLKHKGGLVGIQVGTLKSSEWKQWDLDRMAELADGMIDRYGIQVVLLGGHQETQKARYVRSRMHNSVLDVTGETSLWETAALLQHCDFLICNDTGLMHTSIAVDTPVVAIWGPTDHTRTGPWKNGSVIVRKDLPCSPCYTTTISKSGVHACTHRECLRSITVNDVLRIVEQHVAHLRSTDGNLNKASISLLPHNNDADTESWIRGDNVPSQQSPTE